MTSVRLQSIPCVFLAILTLAVVQALPSASSAQGKSGKPQQESNVPEQLFKDVPLGDPSYRAIALLHSEKLIIGYPEGYFTKKRVLTRFEFAAALSNARLPSAATRNPLQDESVALYNYLSEQFRSEISVFDINKRMAIANQGVPNEETVRQYIKRSYELPVLQPFPSEHSNGR